MALPGWLRRSAFALALFAGFLLVVAAARREVSEAAEPPPLGLPDAPHYHALLVAADDPSRLWLGTHVGLYESRDGGRSWRLTGLEGEDAMSLARDEEGALWAAGHDVLARSTDGGGTWRDVRPRGLPGLDIHAFAADRDVRGLLYAAVAGEGLFRSEDGGKSFSLISHEVGADVVALAVTLDGVVFAGSPENGLMVNANGDGKEWVQALDRPVVALAPSRPKDHDLDAKEHARVLAATDEGVLLTEDKGTTWREVLPLEEGAGPVAWSPSDPNIAYAVGGDGKLYGSDDAGRSWRRVEGRPVSAFRGSRPPPGIAAPDFALRDQSGKLVRMRALRGRAVAVTFLDSQCTDVCPIVAGQVARGLDLLPPRERRRVVALAVTTDPDEDTPASVRRFLRKQGAEGRIRYLLGSEEDVRPVWKAFHVLASADTGVDELHSAPVRVFDPTGTWVSTLHAGADLSPENLAHDLRTALRKDAVGG